MSSIPAWLTRYPVTSTWADHLARGSKGGVDYGTPVRTPVLAPPRGGIIRWFHLSDGSSVIRVDRGDGTATDFLHGHLTVAEGAKVQHMQQIGVTDGRKGTPGAGTSTGAHLHVHDISGGQRRPPYSTIAAFTGIDAAPISPEEEEEPMLTFIARDSRSPWYATDGMTKRLLAPGENQLLVDLGVARFADGGPHPGVKLIGANLDLIPTQEE